MTTRDPTAVEQLAGLLEALTDLDTIPNEAGFVFERGEDIPDSDDGYLRGIVALRDTLLGLRRYLNVCGLDMPVPGLLVERGNFAQQELERRQEWPYYGRPSRRRAPSTREEGQPDVKEKKQPRKRRRGRIPDVEVGAP